MNIFIIGYTKSGKTSLANHIEKQYSFNHVEASGNLKQLYPKDDNESLLQYTDRLSNIASELLQIDYNYFSNNIKLNLNKNGNNVISGIRNPIDLISLINLNTDLIIFILNDKCAEASSDFEFNGIEAIFSISTFVTQSINHNIVLNYTVNEKLTIEENFKQLSNKIKL